MLAAVFSHWATYLVLGYALTLMAVTIFRTPAGPARRAPLPSNGPRRKGYPSLRTGGGRVALARRAPARRRFSLR